MKEFIITLSNTVLDTIELFFNVFVLPSASYVFFAFLVSLCITGISAISYAFNIFSFVDIDEAVTANIILLVLVLIDSQSRQSIKGNLNKVKRKFVVTEEQLEDNSEDVQENTLCEDNGGNSNG